MLAPTRGRGGDSPSTPSGREEIAESSATRDPNDLPERPPRTLCRYPSGPDMERPESGARLFTPYRNHLAMESSQAIRGRRRRGRPYHENQYQNRPKEQQPLTDAPQTVRLVQVKMTQLPPSSPDPHFHPAPDPRRRGCNEPHEAAITTLTAVMIRARNGVTAAARSTKPPP